jgi:DNA-binding response OmpR family regulator
MTDGAMKRILLIDGDPDLRRTLATVLSSRRREVIGAGSAQEFRALGGKPFALAILDLNLPDDSGFALIRFLRRSSPTRIIVHTRRDTLTDRVEAYTQGADIYMVKPTAEAELLAAVDSALSRSFPEPAVEDASWRMDRTGGLLAPGGERVTLTSRQAAFLECLIAASGKPVARDALRRAIGIEETDESGRSLDMFVRRMRAGIEAQTGQRGPIKTVYRLGFAFEAGSFEALDDVQGFPPMEMRAPSRRTMP